MCHIRREKGKPSFPILDLYGNERLISLLRERGGRGEKKGERIRARLTNLSPVTMRPGCSTLVLQLLIFDTHIYAGVTHGRHRPAYQPPSPQQQQARRKRRGGRGEGKRARQLFIYVNSQG